MLQHTQSLDWRCATSFPSYAACFQRSYAVPTVFDSFLLYRSLAAASAPYGVVSIDMQPLRIWTKNYDVSQPCRVPLNWTLCLESEGGRYIPHASKPTRPICSTI